MNKIYFDNAATTRIREEVLREMVTNLADVYGNPSSVYKTGREARALLDKARVQVANILRADASEIFFTGSGTEADNWAIRGIAKSYKDKGNHIITSNIEHHAVLHTCEYLEKNGYEVTYLPVNSDGIVEIEDLKKAIRPETILITIMFANNEIGTIQPITEIGKVAKENGIIFHTDAVQAVGADEIDVNAMNIDLLALSAHKLHGPKGVGALYVRKGVKLEPFIHGGKQEAGKRAGTENVAGIAALGHAVELLQNEMQEKNEKVLNLRNMIIDELLEKIPYSRLNGSREHRLPGNINISFEFIEGESMLLLLDMKGIAASSGSACTSGSLDPSHVLLALGLSHEIAHGSLRISIGMYNTEEEAKILITELEAIVKRLREMSPLWNDFINKQ
ncbi:MAG: cysteine desulfurase NifS [Defluviitaleaceae bacterium]|nr:cysteine desulfurase NifS [Defluviitaleaceae bacterium]